MDVPCAPPSRNPAKEVAAVLAVLGSRTAETPGIRSLDTRGSRASRRAKVRSQILGDLKQLFVNCTIAGIMSTSLRRLLY